MIYIIKENRTYDQVFGDVKEGNGDPSLVMFGEKVSPNHHKLARDFVLLDNLYCNGQVSRDGHPWSTMAYNTDPSTSRDWHLTASSRTGVDDDDGCQFWPRPLRPHLGTRARGGIGVSVNDGEYGRRQRTKTDWPFPAWKGAVPGLIGHMCENYGISKILAVTRYARRRDFSGRVP